MTMAWSTFAARSAGNSAKAPKIDAWSALAWLVSDVRTSNVARMPIEIGECGQGSEEASETQLSARGLDDLGVQSTSSSSSGTSSVLVTP